MAPPQAARLQTDASHPDLFTFEFDRPLVPRLNLSRYWRHWNIPWSAVRSIFDRPERQSHGPEKVRAIAPESATISRTRRKRLTMAAVAASVIAAMFWIGANAGSPSKDAPNHGVAQPSASIRFGSEAAGTREVSPAAAPASRAEFTVYRHPLEWFRSAAMERATTQLTESFDRGMAQWGAGSTGWAPGWSHSPDGYVRPGQLALFQPSLSYNDYRLEFFAEIENKSLSWVVRGQDRQNYYAMKFSVVETGLRPVISMVHYPVVGGKQGHTVELPLSAMVHNHTPYHVAVEVKGNHYTAFLEGQEVDSWSDDTLLAGGVGFFSEAGARARVYWVKVYKNDDWFGRLCHHIVGGADSRQAARLERPAPLVSLFIEHGL